MKSIALLHIGLIAVASLSLGTACVSSSVPEPSVECAPSDLAVVASGEFINLEANAFCFYALDLAQASLDYRLNRDGSIQNLPLIPWSNVALRLNFVGADPLNSHFTVHLQNSVLDSAAAFSSPPVPLTAELILDRLLSPGDYPVIGRGINERGYDARIEFSNDRFGGYSYHPYPGPMDAGTVSIISSALTTDELGEPAIELSLTFSVVIRQYYDPNSARELRNGTINVQLPLDDLLP